MKLPADPDLIDSPTPQQTDALEKWLTDPAVIETFPDPESRLLQVPMKLRWRGFHVYAQRIVRQRWPSR